MKINSIISIVLLFFSLNSSAQNTSWAREFELQEYKEAAQAEKEKNYYRAFDLYEKLAKKGYPFSGGALGSFYESGQGTPKNMAMAVYWYEKVAKDNALVWLNLAAAYKDGDGVTKNDRKAYYWYQKAADSGMAIGQRMTSYRYLKGVTGPADKQKGYFWALLAAKQGDKASIKLVEIVEKKLTAEERMAAQGAALNWKPNY